MNTLLGKFKEYGFIPDEIEIELLARIKILTRQKGDYFLRQGQAVSSLFILEKGLVRAFYSRGEREINSWFGFENIILGSIMPLFYDKPSSETIQFLEPSIVHYIASHDLNELYQKYNELNTIGRKMAEEYCVILEERIMALQTESAEQRYNSLLTGQPDATQRISLGHIASYLGITQETLSRIRNK